MNKIELTTLIKAPIELCFDLARSIDLHKISVQHTNEEAVAVLPEDLSDPTKKYYGKLLTLASVKPWRLK